MIAAQADRDGVTEALDIMNKLIAKISHSGTSGQMRYSVHEPPPLVLTLTPWDQHSHYSSL